MTQDSKYAKVREHIVSFIERRRDAFGSRPKDVDNDETDSHTQAKLWWGGADAYWSDEAVECWPEKDLSDAAPVGKNGTGDGGKCKGAGFGKGREGRQEGMAQRQGKENRKSGFPLV